MLTLKIIKEKQTASLLYYQNINNVKIQNNVSVYTGVIIEDDVFLGPSCVFTNVINPRSFISRKNEYKKTIVKKYRDYKLLIFIEPSASRLALLH